MMTDPLGRVLDATVPPIPEELASPPYQRIRRLVRLRRLTSATASAAAAILLIAASIALFRPADGLSTVSPGAPNSPQPTDATPRRTAKPGTSSWPLTVRVARVTEDGMGLTLYVNPNPEVCIVSPLSIGLEVGPERVVVDADGAGIVDCDNIRVAEMFAPVSGPLGERTLYDADGTEILTVREADLPVLPEPLRLKREESSYLDGSFIGLVYGHWSTERTVIITASREAKPIDVIAEEVPLGRHTGTVVFTGHNYGVRWQSRGLLYELLYFPDPGEGVTREGFLDFLATCHWR